MMHSAGSHRAALARTPMSRRDHWNAIFAESPDEELGWYEADVSPTLRFLDAIPPRHPFTTFLPGAGTSRVVEALLARGHQLVLNDVSDEALRKLRARVGDRPGVAWVHADVAQPLPPGTPQADLWLDRAVLHFLLDEQDIAAYVRNLDAVVKPGGWVLLAQFSNSGAPKCAGLDVHRYSAGELGARLGPAYALQRQEDHTSTNPWGAPRPYVYALFRKRGA
jgi:EEF1A lysine methyltransferase 2